MSATPPTPATPRPYPEPTRADRDAMFASVVWFREDCPKELVEKYYGMYVAILGEEIIDSDADANELGRRIEALGDAIPVNRVVLQYVHRPEDWNWK
jgi:hypothetical protein